jgi:hypothetical protein
MARLCKVCACSHSIAENAGSNSDEGLDFVLCFVGNGLCDKLITRSEDFYRVCVCVCMCVCVYVSVYVSSVRSRNLNSE